MKNDPDHNLPIDPSRVVADRRWSAPTAGPSPQAADDTAGDNWLSGLVKEEPEGSEESPSDAPVPPPQPAVPHSPAKVESLTAGKPSPPETDENSSTQEVSIGTVVARHKRAKKQTRRLQEIRRPSLRTVSAKDKATLFRALSAMFDSGVPLFATFEFLAREGENARVCEACRRIAQRLVAGHSLTAAVRDEPEVFDLKAVRMLEAGFKGGQLSQILTRLATDEEVAWKLTSSLKAQLTYPISVALFTLLAVIFLPPLVLADLLRQVVSLTSEPPALTRLLLKVSEALASPWTWISLVAVIGGTMLWLRSPGGRRLLENLEPEMWSIPAVGELKRGIVGLRFLRVFTMTYQAGLPVLLGMELAATATGSVLAARKFPLMKQTLMEGGTLTEAFEASDFLPQIALEAISAGESSGQIPVLLESAANILETELATRIEAVAKLIEPLILAILGMVVGTFVLGCLLPIVELTAKL